MHRMRGTFILVIIAVLLALWIFLFERGPAPEGKLLLSIDPNKVEKLELQNLKEGKKIVLNRAGKETWRIISPVNTPANNDTVKSMLDRLQRVKIELSLNEDALKKKEFGFEKPEGAISIELKGGKRYRLVLAKKTPDTLYAYAYREDKRKPVVVDSMLLDDALKSLDDLREKHVAKFDKEKVEKLALRYANEELLCERTSDNRWRIVKPIRTNADENTINTLLDKLSTLEASKFVDDKPTEEALKKYGLQEPSFSVTVWLKGRKKGIQLSVGSKSEEDASKLYARSSYVPSVFLIDERNLNDIRKRLNDLRSKRLLTFETGKVSNLRLIHDGKEIVLERRKQGEREEWMITKPVRMRADNTTVTNLLWDVHDLEAQRFIDKPEGLEEYGLDKPQVTVELGEEKKTLKLFIGKPASDKTLYAKTNEQEVVCEVPRDILEKVRKDVNDLRNLEIVRFERDDAVEVTIEWLEDGKEKQVCIERKGKDEWDVTKPKRKKADSVSVSNILWTLEQVRAEKYVGEETGDKKFGFEKPQLVATVKLKGHPPIKLIIGAYEAGKNNVYLKSSEVKGVYSKSDYILEDLKRYAKELLK